ncbi:MAG TPA: hypothetical protein VF911_07940 [Thermoanaerobaculia bacterium]|jgi:hypothetical protein
MSISNAPQLPHFPPGGAKRRSLLERLLPPTVDNTYGGHKLALWLFAAVVFMKTAISVNSVLNGRFVATTDGIPLASYPPAAARAVVSLFALLGLAQFTVCLVCMLVLARYRSLVPFMLSLLLAERLSRKLLFHWLGSPQRSSPVSVVLMTLMIAGAVLSFWPQRREDDAAS